MRNPGERLLLPMVTSQPVMPFSSATKAPSSPPPPASAGQNRRMLQKKSRKNNSSNNNNNNNEKKSNTNNRKPRYWFDPDSGFSLVSPGSTLFSAAMGEDTQGTNGVRSSAKWLPGVRRARQSNDEHRGKVLTRNGRPMGTRSFEHLPRARTTLGGDRHRIRRLSKCEHAPITGTSLKTAEIDEEATLIIDTNVYLDDSKVSRMQREVLRGIPLARSSSCLAKTSGSTNINVQIRQTDSVPGPHFGGTDQPAAFCELLLPGDTLSAIRTSSERKLQLNIYLSETLKKYLGVAIDRYYLRLLSAQKYHTCGGEAEAVVSTMKARSNAALPKRSATAALGSRRPRSRVTWADVKGDLSDDFEGAPIKSRNNQGDWLMDRKLHTSQDIRR